MKIRYGIILALLACCSQSRGILVDDFDPGIDGTKWDSISLGSATTGAAFLDGNALWFDGAGERSARTISLNTIGGANVKFSFRAGNETVDGTTQWENSESGENVVLEYSTDGASFNTFLTLDTVATTDWALFDLAVPVAAESATTSIRWRQLSNSGSGFDQWAIDNVEINVVPEPATLAFVGIFGSGLWFVRRYFPRV